MPRVVGQIRRGLRRATAAPDADQRTASSAGEPPDQEPDHGGGDIQGGGPLPVLPTLSNPLSPRWPAAGLGLTGPGAAAAARGFLTAALAASGVGHPNARTQVVMPETTAATLLGAAAVNLPHTPRMTVTADLDDALEILEAKTMHRTRLLHQHDVDTVTELRAADPYEEPLPPAHAAGRRHQRPRTRPRRRHTDPGAASGHPRVLLGPWPDGETVVVADDGTITPPTATPGTAPTPPTSAA